MHIAPAIPSATLILLRDAGAIEVLLVCRSKRLDFHGGAWVFPGGRVDLVDKTGGLDELTAAKNAAVRETREEVGLEIERDLLVPVSHWTTPEIAPKRFATWFFAAPYSGGDVRVDGGEIHQHLWLTPQVALERHLQKQIELPPPTFVSLLELTTFANATAALESWRKRKPPVFLPKFVAGTGGVSYSLYPFDAGYESGDPNAPGPRHRLIFAPGKWEYQRLDVPDNFSS